MSTLSGGGVHFERGRGLFAPPLSIQPPVSLQLYSKTATFEWEELMSKMAENCSKKIHSAFNKMLNEIKRLCTCKGRRSSKKCFFNGRTTIKRG